MYTVHVHVCTCTCTYTVHVCACVCMFLHSANFCEPDDITMTSEQARVVVHPITRGEVLKVVAFAGTVHVHVNVWT